MFWNSPQTQNNQTRSIFLLKNSRISDHSTEIDRSFKLGNSFELDTTIINSPIINKKQSTRQNIDRDVWQGRRGSEKQGKEQQIKRKFISKFIINRMLNVRQALKIIQSIPIQIFNHSSSFNLSKQILMKSKINVEISVLRTLFFSHENKNKEACRLKCIGGGNMNIFVLPTPNEVDDAAKQEEELASRRIGLDKLVNVAVLLPLKNAMDSLKKYFREQTAIVRYFNKICANYQGLRQSAFSKMKQLPPKGLTRNAKQKIIAKQLKITINILTNKYSSLLNHSFIVIKTHCISQRDFYRVAAKQMIAFAKLRKEQSLRQWMYFSRTEKVKSEEEVCEDKKQVLSRIVARNYLKLFVEIIRRMRNFQMVARRIGCGSKINQQKSFWRLLINSKRQIKK